MASDLTPDEEASVNAGFAGVEFESAADLEDDGPVAKAKKVRAQEPDDEPDEGPPMTDPKWSEFVLSHFSEDELDPDGRPLVAGLRRVARLLLGPILYSGPAPGLPFQAPSLLTGFEKLGILQPAVVGYMVEILWCRDVQQTGPYKATFVDVADVYSGNTDPDYARHASATASTKAESRCLRKALGLKGIAAEEKTVVPSIEAMLDGMITPDQVNFIRVLCARNDINVEKYINSGKKKYASVYDIEAGVALKMVEYLSDLENGEKNGKKMEVPAHLKGYDKNWKPA